MSPLPLPLAASSGGVAWGWGRPPKQRTPPRKHLLWHHRTTHLLLTHMVCRPWRNARPGSGNSWSFICKAW
ncbi:hypothetical protein BRADI_5g26239v3 [Brachypodium distachyon]|uniref:Uncharacterized protein n=1 Tax=Brachypodium distachyon TaxID=15368 RepID=A0A2K2CJE9_BRADI|nr:hypothetical protein BRADI_5g26239v3 [Brachypodium distachyon]